MKVSCIPFLFVLFNCRIFGDWVCVLFVYLLKLLVKVKPAEAPLVCFSVAHNLSVGQSVYLLLHLNTRWRTLPRRAVRAFLELATRHASHSNGGSRFELELDRRNAARGNAGSRVPSSIHGAQVGVSADYHKTQPASN